MSQTHATSLLEERRSPVKHGKANDINQEVGDGKYPYPAVSEHHPAQELLVFSTALAAFLVHCVYLLKAYRRRSIAQECEDEDRSGECDSGRNPEAHAPGSVMGGRLDDALPALGICCIHVEVGSDRGYNVRVGGHIHTHRAHHITAQDGYDAGTHRVRGVPHGHLRGQFIGRNPVAQQACTGRETASLEEVVE